jgi:hypothetical protein
MRAALAAFEQLDAPLWAARVRALLTHADASPGTAKLLPLENGESPSSPPRE